MKVERSRKFLVLYIILTTWLCVAVCTTQSNYLGIDLGPEYITGSSFTIDQSPVPLLRIRGNNEYRAYLADTLANDGKRQRRSDGDYLVQADGTLALAPPDTHDLQTATKIFMTAFQDVKNAVTAQIGNNLEMISISQPRHFNDSSHQALVLAAERLNPHFQPMQIITFTKAARLAYNLTSCASFGLSPAECLKADDLHFIINVEYHTSYLEIVIAYAHEIALNVKDHIRFTDLGEGILKTHSPKQWLQWIRRTQHPSSSTTTLQHYETMQKRIASFLEEQQHAPVEGYNNLDDLRAVVLSGDATPSGFEALRTAVAAALGLRKDKIREGVEPLYVGAIGAGEWGRYQLRTPGLFDDRFCTAGAHNHSDTEHDEL